MTQPFYRSYQQLANDITNWDLPDFAAVCGIPRSGLIPASILALHRNIHCVPLKELASGKSPWRQDHYGSGRYIGTRDGPVLVIDDTSSSGARMRFVKRQLSGLGLDVKFAAYASRPDGKKELDFCLHDIGNRFDVFQWNIFHHVIFNETILADLDGVLCADWNHDHEEGDLRSAYLDHLENARCLIRPTCQPILGIVTGRLEEHRQRTEAWLKRNSIGYRFLAMCPCASPAERAAKNDGVYHKIRVYRDWGSLFVESDDGQSHAIHHHTGKAVLSWKSQTYYPM